jgi:hypothetical protein
LYYFLKEFRPRNFLRGDFGKNWIPPPLHVGGQLGRKRRPEESAITRESRHPRCRFLTPFDHRYAPTKRNNADGLSHDRREIRPLSLLKTTHSAQLLSAIEGVLGGRLAMTASVRYSGGADTQHMSDIPNRFVASGVSSHLGELIAAVGLRGGSRVTGGLSSRGLANVVVRDWSDDFAFVIGDHRYRCRSSVAQFLYPRVSKLHSADAMISELRLEVEDQDKLFTSMLEPAKGSSIAVDSDHRGLFEGICAALWNSELCELVCGQQRDDFTMDNVLNRLRFRSANQYDISGESGFVASHFDDFPPRPRH